MVELTGLKDFFDLRAGSVAGEMTSLFLRQLHLLFDCGLYHSDFLSARHVFLSHGHIDHCGGLFLLLGRNNLTGAKPFSVYIPQEIYADIMSLKSIYEKMNNVVWKWLPYSVCGGSQLELNSRLSVFCYDASHGSGALSYGIREKKKRLKSCYSGKSPEELRQLAGEGLCLNEELLNPLLFYSGDTGPEIFDNQEMFDYENVVMECTFVSPEQRADAAKWRHLHIDDFLINVHKFKSKNLILTHFSARYNKEQINEAVEKVRTVAPAGLNIQALQAIG
jgi:ribonuclease Z